MDSKDRATFALLIDSLAENFGGKQASEALLEAYWMALEDLPLDAVKRAVGAAIRQSKYMPKGVDLRELAGEMPTANRAVLAWSVLQRALAQHGAYRSVDFDDQVLNATVRNLGGWQRLCGLASEELEKWTRKDFDRVYGALCASGVSAEQARHLVGIHEQNNIAAGHAPSPPVRIATGLPPHREGTVRELGPVAEVKQLRAGNE